MKEIFRRKLILSAAFALSFAALAAGAAAYYFYTKNKDDVDLFVQKTEKELGEKIKQNAGETKKSIDQGIPSNSKYTADREGMVK